MAVGLIGWVEAFKTLSVFLRSGARCLSEGIPKMTDTDPQLFALTKFLLAQVHKLVLESTTLRQVLETKGVITN